MTNTDKPLISVVIPAYNRAYIIKDSLQSVLDQTYTNIEVVVVDDGSSDETADVIDAIEDERVLKCVRVTPNQGPSHARNAGVDAANGDYIAFQDSDDFWKPDKLEKQYQLMIDGGYDMVGCGMIRTERGRTFFFPKSGFPEAENLVKEITLENRIGTPTVLIKKEAFNRVRFDEGMRGMEDWDFGIRTAKALKIGFVNEALFESEVQPNSLSKVLNQCKLLENLYHKHEDLINSYTDVRAFYMRGIGNGYLYEKPATAFRYYLESLKCKWSIQSFIRLLMSIAFWPFIHKKSTANGQ